MNNQEKEFNNVAENLKGVSLRTEEKDLMLQNIYKIAENDSLDGSIASPFVYSSFFRRRSLVALTAMFLLSAGTTYASLGSLPGEPLYEMKVSVLEPIGTIVRFSEEEKDDYRVSLLRERVAEIERLKEAGRLVSYTETASSRAAQRNITDIESSSSLDDNQSKSEIDTHVKTYNSIIADEALKLKTKIQLDILEETLTEIIETTSSTTSEIEGRRVLEGEVVDEVVEEVERVVEEVTKPVEDTVVPIVEEVVPKETKDILDIPKVLKSIGL